MLLLLPQRLSAIGLQGVIFSFAAGFGFDPATAHQALVFEPMENGVKHTVGPLDFSAGQFLDALNDRVTVTIAF